MALQFVDALVERASEFAGGLMHLRLCDHHQLEHSDLQLADPLQQKDVTLAAITTSGALRRGADGHQKHFGGVEDVIGEFVHGASMLRLRPPSRRERRSRFEQ
jgi:hypothetical protein